jgi:hypothetical protein
MPRFVRAMEMHDKWVRIFASDRKPRLMFAL